MLQLPFARVLLAIAKRKTLGQLADKAVVFVASVYLLACMFLSTRQTIYKAMSCDTSPLLSVDASLAIETTCMISPLFTVSPSEIIISRNREKYAQHFSYPWIIFAGLSGFFLLIPTYLWQSFSGKVGPLFVTLDIGEELKNCNEEERINVLNPLVNDLSIKIEENVENNSHRRFATPYLNNLNLKYLVRGIVKCRDLSKEEMGTAELLPPPLETVNKEIYEEQTVDASLTDEQRE